MKSGAKILVVRFSSIGDIVLTSAVIRCLRLQTDAEVHFLTKKKFSSLLETNPHIDKVWTIESSIKEVVSSLRKVGFDAVVDLHHNIRSAQVKRQLSCKAYTLNKLNAAKWLLVNFGIDKLPDKHVVDRYMEVVEPMGIKNDHKGLDFFFPQDYTCSIALSQPYIVAAIGGQHDGKRLPLNKWTEIMGYCSSTFVVIGGEADNTVGQALAEKHENVINLCGQTSLFDSAALIKTSNLVITNDTGMMHIAAAFKRIIISLWGQTTPRFGMYPYMPDERSLIVEPNPKKRRLSKLGNRSTNPHVMEKIDTTEVVNHIKYVLAEQIKP